MLNEDYIGYLIKLKLSFEKSHIELQANKQNYPMIEKEVETFSDKTKILYNIFLKK